MPGDWKPHPEPASELGTSGHKTESVYRQYVSVSETRIAEGLGKAARFREGQVISEPTIVRFMTAR